MVFIASNLKRVPIIKEDVIITPINEESILYPSYLDEENLPYVITLDEIGTFILNSIDGTRCLDDILKIITDNYDVDLETAKIDLFDLINDLEEGKIIIWKR